MQLNRLFTLIKRGRSYASTENLTLTNKNEKLFEADFLAAQIPYYGIEFVHLEQNKRLKIFWIIFV
ncbi:hypothetical protein [Holospora curviuscula]|uniref:hypothetical protein n=1 Tax=Holospora curviuscula TaxID=1082868 RepID=UPI000CE5857E|nr:hypothetical protein [Holospora curviuscula]